MKPCRHCGAPIPNPSEACPECGKEQEEPVHLRAEESDGEAPPEPLTGRRRRQWIRRELATMAWMLLKDVLGYCVLVGLGAAAGYLLGGERGLVVGAVAGLLVKLLLL